MEDNLEYFRKQGYMPQQLAVITQALNSSIDRNLLEKYVFKPDLNNLQMEIILAGLINGLNIDLYANENIPYEEMQQIYEKLLKEKQLIENKETKSKVVAKTISFSKKMYYTLTLISILSIFAILYFVLYPIYQKQNEKIVIDVLKDNIKIEHNTTFDINKYIDIKKYQNSDKYHISFSNYDLNKIGKQIITITVSNNFKKASKNLNIEVIDSIKPHLVLSKNEITIFKSKIGSFDPLDYVVEVSDNYDKLLKTDVTIEKYNLDLGENIINYILTDSSKNTITKSLKVYVKNDPPKPKPIERTENKDNNNNQINNTNYQPNINSESNHKTKDFINGVRDLTIKKDSDLGNLVHILTSNISASKSISVDYSSVNLSVAGQYTVTYHLADTGINKTCTVTVVD